MQERDIFDAALAIADPAERAAYLAQACEGDAAQQVHLQELLEMHGQLGSFLQAPAAALAGTVAESPSERPGTVIGPYKLLEQIGEGGFGVVFMAEQSHPVRRKVALKILKPGMDTRQVVARFEAERQALAIMDHPNIAKVLHGGETDSGRPYFVMELVKGVPITEFCDQNHLAPRERLELFIPVCHAVQHAHQKGIIHRDLKPSNILVSRHDTTPIVKIIDFGVAKALGQELTANTLFTGFAQMIGTPLYMSPEQAGMSDLDIDTRSDIYSLGVLLYELLTGTTPFDKERLKEAGYDEIRRIIREEEPARPSTRMSTLGQAAATVSANRQSDARRLKQLFRGELDWIVMKALEKDRNRRYESASAFAADVQRYLHDEPALACPPSALYRFRKFARRNKAALATAVVVALAVLLTVAGLATSTVLIAREQRATAKALQAEIQAKDDLEKALYLHRIALSQHELLDYNLLQAEELLDQCPADRRAWEWYCLKRLCHVEPVALRGQLGGRFQKVAFNPDGRLLASAGEDKTVKVWDATTGEEVLVLSDTGEVRCVAFNPSDGRWLVTGDTSGAVKVWNTRTRQVVRALKHSGAVHGLAFSPNGRLFASASEDTTVKVWDWDATTDDPVHILRGHARSVVTVAFSPDGKHLASGSVDTTVTIWDTTTGQPIRTLRGHRDPVTGVAFSPDGRRLASASFDKTVKIWDVTTEESLTLNGHIRQVHGVVFLDDGRRLASVSHDKTMKIWDATTGAVVLTLRGHTQELNGLACSPDGRRLASVSEDRTTKIWDATPVDAKAGQEVLTLRGHTNDVYGLAFRPDGAHLASASQDTTVRVWDARSGREELVFGNHVKVVFSVAFSPDGRRIASGSARHTEDEPSILKVWDVVTGREVFPAFDKTAFGKTGEALSVAFSPGNGRWIVTGGRGVTVWDGTTGQLVHKLGPHGKTVWGVAFSPDGRRLASLSREGIVTVHDATRWPEKPPQEPLTFRAHKTPVHGSLAFSHDGQRLVVPGDENTVNIWDVTTTDKPQLTLRGHERQVWGVAFSPDGRWVASAGEDNTVKLWDAKTGELIRSFRGHSSIVSRVAFSPKEKRLASASFDKTVKVWDLTSLYEKAKK